MLATTPESVSTVDERATRDPESVFILLLMFAIDPESASCARVSVK